LELDEELRNLPFAHLGASLEETSVQARYEIQRFLGSLIQRADAMPKDVQIPNDVPVETAVLAAGVALRIQAGIPVLLILRGETGLDVEVIRLASTLLRMPHRVLGNEHFKQLPKMLEARKHHKKS